MAMHFDPEIARYVAYRPLSRENGSDVRTTIVDGRELLTIDVPAVVKEIGERMPALLDRSHGKRIKAYTT